MSNVLHGMPMTTVLPTSFGKMLFAWRFILNVKIIFFLFFFFFFFFVIDNISSNHLFFFYVLFLNVYCSTSVTANNWTGLGNLYGKLNLNFI